MLSDDSLIRTHTVAWVTGVIGAPLIGKLELPTERGRLKVTTAGFVGQKADPELGWRMEVNRPRASLGKRSTAVIYDR